MTGLAKPVGGEEEARTHQAALMISLLLASLRSYLGRIRVSPGLAMQANGSSLGEEATENVPDAGGNVDERSFLWQETSVPAPFFGGRVGAYLAKGQTRCDRKRKPDALGRQSPAAEVATNHKACIMPDSSAKHATKPTIAPTRKNRLDLRGEQVSFCSAQKARKERTSGIPLPAAKYMTFLGLGGGSTSFPSSTSGSRFVSEFPATPIEPYSAEPVDDSEKWCG